MPLLRSDAFVLRTYKLGEADQIAVFFTREYGKVRVAARSSRNPRRSTAGYYQPLTLLNVILFGKQNQSLYRMQSLDIVQTYRTVREDFTLLRCGLYMTELIDVGTRDREAAPEVFALFHRTLEALGQAPHPMYLLRLFETKLAIALGYAPQVLACARCEKPLPADTATFSAPAGGLLCADCTALAKQTLAITPATVQILRSIMATDTLSLEAPDSTTQQELEQLLHQHLTYCLGRELKSYVFLQL